MLTIVKKKITITIVIEFLANNVVNIEILIKNIGTGGTPAILKIAKRDSTFKEFVLVITCKAFK